MLTKPIGVIRTKYSSTSPPSSSKQTPNVVVRSFPELEPSDTTSRRTASRLLGDHRITNLNLYVLKLAEDDQRESPSMKRTLFRVVAESRRIASLRRGKLWRESRPSGSAERPKRDTLAGLPFEGGESSRLIC